MKPFSPLLWTFAFLTSTLAFPSSLLYAQDLPEKIQKVIDKYGPDLISAADFRNGHEIWGDQRGVLEVASIDDEGRSTLRISNSLQPVRPWDMQLVVPVNSDFRRGDTLMVVVQLRSIKPGHPESGESRTSFYFQAPEKILRQENITFGSAWQTYAPAFTAVNDKPEDGANLVFHLGVEPQTVEVSNITVYNFGKEVKPSQLPQPSTRYDMLDDTDWRPAAEERIASLRKAQQTFRLLDNAGEPLSNVPVRLQMQKHAFPFGTAVSEYKLTRNDADAEMYRTLIPLLFNSVTPETSMKWKNFLSHPERSEALVDFANKHALRVYGHVLVWPSWRKNEHIKPDIAPDVLRENIREYIETISSEFRDHVRHWDVLNEPYDNHDWIDMFGREEIVKWFQLAQEFSPEAKLFINDYQILSDGGLNSKKQEFYRELIEWLLDRDAPLHGIGMQGHFGTQITPIPVVLQILDDFGKTGLPISVTEFDVAAPAELQASYTHDFLTAVFSHPSVDSFTMWGFWDGQHWRPNAGILDHAFQLKKNGTAYIDLVFGEWWTDVETTTDANGILDLDGFKGDYVAYVKTSEGTLQIPFTLTDTSLERQDLALSRAKPVTGEITNRQEQILAALNRTTTLNPVFGEVLTSESLKSARLIGQAREDFKMAYDGAEGVIRADILSKPERPWNMQFWVDLDSDLAAASSMHLTFEARTAAALPDNGLITVAHQMSSSGFHKIAIEDIAVSSEWTEFSMDYSMSGGVPAGMSAIIFQLGHKPQTIEIRNLRLKASSP